MKIKLIILFLLISSTHSIFAQQDVCYYYNLNEMLSNSSANLARFDCSEFDSILNRDPISPELGNATFYKRDLDSIIIYGTVCYIEKRDSGVLFCTRLLPCCAGNIVSYSWCQMNRPYSGAYDTICKISHTTATEMPNSFNAVWNLKDLVVEKDCKLRANPIEDDVSENYELRAYGNVVGQLKVGTRVNVLAEQVMSDSRWYFVAVELSDGVTEAYYDETDTAILGWLKAD